jgi:hypothetical protein
MSDIFSAGHQRRQSKDKINQRYERPPGTHTPSFRAARYVSPDDYNEAPGGFADRSPRTALTQATQSASRLEQSTRTRVVVVALPAWPDWIVVVFVMGDSTSTQGRMDAHYIVSYGIFCALRRGKRQKTRPAVPCPQEPSVSHWPAFDWQRLPPSLVQCT